MGDTLAVILYGMIFIFMAALIISQNIDFLSFTPYPTLHFPHPASSGLAAWVGSWDSIPSDTPTMITINHLTFKYPQSEAAILKISPCRSPREA